MTVADRGYIPYKPQAEAAYWLDCTRTILAQYREEWPLTVRQVFYRLVAAYDFPKTEKAYQNLIKIMARARRASPLKNGGKGIPFDAIRDDRGSTVDPFLFQDADEFREWLLNDVIEDQFMLNRMEGQDTVIELWCEAGGMVPIMRNMARPYGVKVSSGHGYDSVTAKHKLAIRARDRHKQGKKTLLLHVGDFDGSGEDMCTVLHEDVLMMYAQWTGDYDGFEVKRVALTEDQVIEYDVITAPPKPTDSRTAKFVRAHPDLVDHFGSTDIAAQLEALTPPQLRELVTTRVEENIDMTSFNDQIEREDHVRQILRDRLTEVDWNEDS